MRTESRRGPASFRERATTLSATIPRGGIAMCRSSRAYVTGTSIPALTWSTTAIRGGWSTTLKLAPGADPAYCACDFGRPERKAGDWTRRAIWCSRRKVARSIESPHLYQTLETSGGRWPGISCCAVATVGFAVGAYDRGRILVIDPVLTYSTYLGGSGAESCSAITGAAFTPGCPAIAVDLALNMYVAGSTTSTNFPVLQRRHRST